jgi:hypothetical protein
MEQTVEGTTNGGDIIQMLSLEKFARSMAVCPNTVRNWIKSGRLLEGKHFYHIGHIYRFPWGADFVKELMSSLAPPPSPPARPKLHSLSANRRQLQYRA